MHYFKRNSMKKLFFVTLLAVSTLMFTACSTKGVKNYMISPYEMADSVESKLAAAGFEVLARVKPIKKKDIETFVLTNDYIKKLANRPTRGLLASVIRVTVNKDMGQVRITNPLLYFKAYLQDDYKEGDEQPVVDALMKAFPNAIMTDMQKNEDGEMVDANVEKLPGDSLADYHFMIGMPYYHDMDELAENTDINVLLKKLKKGAKKIKSTGKKSQNLSYLIELSPTRYVAGLRLSKRTEKFAKKIGLKNIGLLPWGVLIEVIEEDGVKVAYAKALNAKYRIALNYSDLDMGGFMGIMTVPGAITKELSKVFK